MFLPPENLQQLRQAAIALKHRLSEVEQDLPPFPVSHPDGRPFAWMPLSRAELGRLMKPVVDRTMGPVKEALADAHLKPEDMDEVVLVGGATRTPLIRHTVEEFFGRNPHIELNPDEVVALGAAVQANILDQGVKTMLLLSTSRRSPSASRPTGGAVAKIIPRNSTIPASAQELYTTGVDNQTGIDIHVLQGERELAKDCRSLARFTLRVPHAPAGLPRIEVEIPHRRQWHPPGWRQGSSHRPAAFIEVQPSYGINDSEIERMLEESIEYAEQDFAERQVIEARNESESILSATAKALASPQAAGLSDDERAKIDASLAALKVLSPVAITN